MKNFCKKFIYSLILLTAVVSTTLFIGCDDDSLKDKELKVYDLVLDCSYKFKNPSSVRIISGTVNYNPENDTNFISAYLRLSSTNIYGATTSDYYFCGYNVDNELFIYNIDAYEVPTTQEYKDIMKKATALSDFNIKAVNKKLDKYWEF